MLMTITMLAKKMGIKRVPMYLFLMNRKGELIERGVLIEVEGKCPKYLVDYEKYIEYLRTTKNRLYKQREKVRGEQVSPK